MKNNGIMSLKWEKDGRKFTSYGGNGYYLFIEVDGPFGCAYWSITKDAVIVDECYRHPPVIGELRAKVAAEINFKQILTTL